MVKAFSGIEQQGRGAHHLYGISIEAQEEIPLY
jgi:hypothetical protein